jgi:hypothetical protein
MSKNKQTNEQGEGGEGGEEMSDIASLEKKRVKNGHKTDRHRNFHKECDGLPIAFDFAK